MPPPASRTPKVQMGAAVEIDTTCNDFASFVGSGTIVRSGRVLTALHVIDCSKHNGVMLIMVKPDTEHVFMLSRGVEVPSLDVALLESDASELAPWYTPISIAPPPDYGDRLCEAAAWPRWTYRCGDVEYVSDKLVKLSMFTEFGNSGAAVYDHSGRLVGVTDWTNICQGAFQCVDGVIPVTSLAWYIEE